MNYVPKIDRRSFVIGTAAAGAGFSLGMSLPFGAAHAQGGTPELNAWVVVKPDDTVVVRFCRSEMGQGALTGLCQLVAEELECDWSKVTWEYVDPRENIRRKRIYGNFNSTGSNAIRQSHDYVRRGGAAARQMLIQAAAAEWKVPASECTAANSLITHTPSGRKTSYGKVVNAAPRSSRRIRRASRSRTRRPGRSPASRSRGLIRWPSSPASRSTRSTPSCPACSTPRSRPARCAAASS